MRPLRSGPPDRPFEFREVRVSHEYSSTHPVRYSACVGNDGYELWVPVDSGTTRTGKQKGRTYGVRSSPDSPERRSRVLAHMRIVEAWQRAQLSCGGSIPLWERGINYELFSSEEQEDRARREYGHRTRPPQQAP